MSSWSDLDHDVQPVPLDPNTADRLLCGAIAPEDAPPGYAEVTRLLDAALAPSTDEELAREAETVQMMAAAVRSSQESDPASPRRSLKPFALTRPRATAALVAAGLACSTSLAFAGALPGAAQQIASTMLAKVGVTVPGPNENAGTHPGQRGSSSTVTPSTAGEGVEISELPTTIDLKGVEKDASISAAASDGKSQAGQHGNAAGADASEAPPVETPNSGGTDTADTASGGSSANGTSTADAASDGHSSAGCANAHSGQERAHGASDGHSSAGCANAHSGQERAHGASDGHSSAGCGNAHSGQERAHGASDGHSSAGCGNAHSDKEPAHGARGRRKSTGAENPP
jgi:hypothetical protein